MAAQMGLKFLFSPLHWIVNPCWLKDIMVSFYEFVKFYKEHCHSFACGAFISNFITTCNLLFILKNSNFNSNFMNYTVSQ